MTRRLLVLCLVLLTLGLPVGAARVGLVGVGTTDAILVRTAADIANSLHSEFDRSSQWTALRLQAVESALKKADLTIAVVLENPDLVRAGRVPDLDFLVVGTLGQQGGSLKQVFRVINAHTGRWAEATFYRNQNQISQLSREVLQFIEGQTRAEADVVGRTGTTVQLRSSNLLGFYPGQTLGVYRDVSRLSLGSLSVFYTSQTVRVGTVVIGDVTDRNLNGRITAEDLFGPVQVGDLVRPVAASPQAGDLTIRSNPSGAAAYVNGTFVGRTPVTLRQIPVGSYTVEIRESGYQDYSERANIVAGRGATVDARLQTLTGVLTVDANVRGADVFIDGRRVGSTPWTGSLPPGRYTVEVKATGYSLRSETVWIQTGRTETRTFQLVGIPGDLYIASTPSGAQVYLDGNYQGMTPVSLTRLPAGRTYTLKLTYPGYLDHTERITIQAGQARRMDIPLRLPPGTLSVSSTPSGAQVFVDGRRVGTTPTQLELDPGQYRIRIFHEGYREEEVSLRIASGQRESISQQLVPRYGNLVVESNPSGASVYLNNTYRGLTPLTLTDLLIGTYEVRVEQGNLRAQGKVEVRENQTAKTQLILETPYAALAHEQRLRLLFVHDGLQSNGVGLGLSLPFDERIRLAAELQYFPPKNSGYVPIPSFLYGTVNVDLRLASGLGVWGGVDWSSGESQTGPQSDLGAAGGVFYVAPLGRGTSVPIFRGRAGLAGNVANWGIRPVWDLEIYLPIGPIDLGANLGGNRMGGVQFRTGIGLKF